MPMGRAIFAFSAKIGLKSTKKQGILHTLHANEGYSPPVPYPWLPY